MGLLVRRAPELHPGACDMIVDMDRLDALTLRQLQVGSAVSLLAAALQGTPACTACPVSGPRLQAPPAMRAQQAAQYGHHCCSTVCRVRRCCCR